MRTDTASFGYLLPHDGRLKQGSWIVATDDVELHEPEAVPDWSYHVPIRVGVDIEVDLRGLRSDCGLPADAVVRGGIAWHSDHTNLRGLLCVKTLIDGQNEFSETLPGPDLGGRLHLGVQVLLASAGAQADPLAPQRPGSLLWTGEPFITELDGYASRLRVLPLDFASAGVAGGRRALWHVQLSTTELAASSAGSLTVHLNTGHPRVAELLDSPGTPAAADLMRMIQTDVTRQVAQAGLRQGSSELGLRFEAETLGGMVQRVLDRAFPSMSVGEVETLWLNDPGEWEAQLQVLWGVEDE
ncbi:hypothetical protein ACFQ46_07070 [Kineococcus sp. GCM10028916]|uniref:hypothetical protein n=1 Tax=Kineococcus sp. GCM10028916 TaxID=3273394 RepID=UPI003626BA32